VFDPEVKARASLLGGGGGGGGGYQLPSKGRTGLVRAYCAWPEARLPVAGCLPAVHARPEGRALTRQSRALARGTHAVLAGDGPTGLHMIRSVGAPLPAAGERVQVRQHSRQRNRYACGHAAHALCRPPAAEATKGRLALAVEDEFDIDDF
jgi:hypothetical protein